MVKIILIRHADYVTESSPSFLGISNNNSLTKKGITQATLLATYLKKNYPTLQQITSSDLKRSLQTASIIASKFGSEVLVDETFREINFGIFEGLTMEEAEDTYPKTFQERQNDEINFVVPEGESYKDVYERIHPAFNKIIQLKSDDVVAIITHATVIKILSMFYLNMRQEEVDKIHYNHCSLSVIDFNCDKEYFINKYNYLDFLGDTK